MSGGVFGQAARAAIFEAALHRCCGCGTTRGLETQHRRARGMGGTTSVGVGHLANGVALCRSCHTWTETHPTHARGLGWRLDPGDDPTTTPWWVRGVWLRWVTDPEPGKPPGPRDWLVEAVPPTTNPTATTAVTAFDTREHRGAA